MAGPDKNLVGTQAPAFDYFAVTPGTDPLAKVARALYVGTGGDVEVKNLDGDTVVFANVADSTILPIVVTHVLSANTDASDIVALV